MSKENNLNNRKASTMQKVSKTLGDIFIPIIPVLVATGLFIGLRGFVINLGYQLNPNVELFSEILTDIVFMFLPVLVSWSTVKAFGGRPVVGIVLGLMLVAPQLPSAWDVSEGVEPLKITVFGMQLALKGYQGSVIPALFVGIIAAKIEKLLQKVVPEVLEIIIIPFLTLLISVFLGLLIIGPFMNGVEQHVLEAFTSFLNLPFGIGGFIIGGVNQIIVITGMHHALAALEIKLLSQTGLNPFNAAITGAIAAQGAAALAVALKTKNRTKRSLYISSAVPAFLGIGEPAIFGVNLRLIKPFIFALIGGSVAGGFSSMIGLAGNGMGITVLPGILLYLNENIIGYILTNLIGIVVSFALTYLFFEEEDLLEEASKD